MPPKKKNQEVSVKAQGLKRRHAPTDKTAGCQQFENTGGVFY